MSYYCSFTYKGIVKPEYRKDVELAALHQNWGAVQSEELKVLFEGWDDYKSSMMFLGNSRKLFGDNYEPSLESVGRKSSSRQRNRQPAASKHDH